MLYGSNYCATIIGDATSVVELLWREETVHWWHIGLAAKQLNIDGEIYNWLAIG